ncbi:hypothetical protein CL629_04405 [bacterium]|nr:hypothetical protein [bacterium]|tara:strand:+ start:1255 stop:2418 length:1164 start_codon:yes stop_codon:yes gene_type:complete
MRAVFMKIIAIAGSLAAALLIVEALLWALTSLSLIPSYKVEQVQKFYDEKLLYRIEPLSLPEIDENGFRNPTVPDEVDVIGIGDSMTYGYNALTEDSWVYQLGQKTGLSVYNISIGGGGPPQYLLLLDEALKLKPSTIIVGLYLGNDIAGSCSVFRELDFWKSYAVENEIDIDDCVNSNSVYWGTGPQVSSDAARDVSGSLLETIRGSYTISFIKSIDPVKKMIWSFRAKKLLTESSDFYLIEDDALNVLIDYSKSDLIDRKEKAVQNGYEITKILFKEMTLKLGKDQQLVVAIIPTKADVFYDFLQERDHDIPKAHEDSVLMQRELTADFIDYFNDLGVDAVDARPFYEEKILNQNPRLYQEFNRDNHPTKIGYEAIADSLMELFQ